jgi:RNA polymerase sigma-70 factor (ECF subfamily)
VQTYQPYWAALGHLRARVGDKDGAIEALTVAIGLTTDAAVRSYLHGRIAALQDG